MFSAISFSCSSVKRSEEELSENPMRRVPQTGVPSDRSSSYRLSASTVYKCGTSALPLLVFYPSRIVCRFELDPMFRVGMLDVAACVLSNSLMFLRGIQSLWIFLQIYSFLNTPPFRMALIALIQFLFTCG